MTGAVSAPGVWGFGVKVSKRVWGFGVWGPKMANPGKQGVGFLDAAVFVETSTAAIGALEPESGGRPLWFLEMNVATLETETKEMMMMMGEKEHEHETQDEDSYKDAEQEGAGDDDAVDDHDDHLRDGDDLVNLLLMMMMMMMMVSASIVPTVSGVTLSPREREGERSCCCRGTILEG